MAESKVSFLLTLRDLASEGLKGIRGGLQGVKDAAVEVATETGAFASSFKQAVPEITAGLAGISAELLDIGKSMGFVGKQMVKVGGIISAAFVIPIASAAKFQASMTTVATLIDQTKVTTEEFSDTVAKLAPQVGKDFNDLADGLFQVVSAVPAAGEDVGAAMNILSVAAKAATGGLTETATAVKVITGALNAYGREAGDAGEISDQLFQAAKLGVTNFDLMASSLGSVLPFAAALDIKFDEVSAALSTMTSISGNTAESATALRNTFASFVQQADLFRKAGVDILQVIGEKGLAGGLNVLQDLTGGNIERMQKFIPNIRSLGGVLTLTGTNASKFAETLNSIRDSAGETDKAFELQRDTLVAAFKDMKIALQGFFRVIGEPLLSKLTKATKFIASFIAGITKSIIEMGDFAKAVILSVSALATLLVVAGTILIILAKLAPLILLVKVAFGGWGAITKIVSTRLVILNHALTLTVSGVKKLIVSVKAMGPALKALSSGLAVVAVGLGTWQLTRWTLENTEWGRSVEKWMTSKMIDLQVELAKAKLAILEFVESLPLVNKFNPFKTTAEEQKLYIKTLESSKEGILNTIGPQQEAAKAVEKTTEATAAATEENKKLEQSYEDLIDELEEGSAEWLEIEKARLGTTKANIELETALEEQKFSKGTISLRQFLQSKKQALEAYNQEVLRLKEIELEALKSAPELDIQAIAALEEEIVQITIENKKELIKLETEYREGLKEKRQESFDNWKELQDSQLNVLKSNLELEDALQQVARDNGLISESEFLANRLERTKQFYEAQLESAQENIERITRLEGQGSVAAKEAIAEREALELKLKGVIAQTEQDIADTKIQETIRAQEFVSGLIGQTQELEELRYAERLEKLNQFYDQGLITSENYYAALEKLDADRTDAASEGTEEVVKSKGAEVDALVSLTDEIFKGIVKYKELSAQVKDTDSFASSLVNTFERFGKTLVLGAQEAALLEVAMEGTVEDLLAAAETTDNTAATVRKYGDDLAAMRRAMELSTVATQLRAEAERKLQEELQNTLDTTVDEYKNELARLRGDEIFLLEDWYGEQVDLLKERFDDELGKTAEFYEAKEALDELYREKKKNLEEDTFEESTGRYTEYTDGIKDLTGQMFDIDEKAEDAGLGGLSGLTRGGLTGQQVASQQVAGDETIEDLEEEEESASGRFISRINAFGASMAETIVGSIGAWQNAALSAVAGIGVTIPTPTVTRILEDNREQTINIGGEPDTKSWYYNQFRPIDDDYKRRTGEEEI